MGIIAGVQHIYGWTPSAGQILGCSDPCDPCGVDAYAREQFPEHYASELTKFP